MIVNISRLWVAATRLVCVGLLLASGSMAYGQADPTQVRKENFKGVIDLDIRKSKADWGPYTPKRAPAGAPNI